MPITKNQMLANEHFFERTFHMLNDNGIWTGDYGTMQKCGNVFHAKLKTYIYIKQIVTKEWLQRRVKLI